MTTDNATPGGAGHNAARLKELFRTMVRIRAFEETAMAAHQNGEMPGPLHVSIGQEGVAAGVCANLRDDDRLTSNHRGHGHALAKGAQPDAMFGELFGRESGYCKGKGGSMHIADFSVGMLGANGVVGGGIPIAVGAAQGLKMLGSNAVAVCMFGDGAANRGPFLEGLNWAALYKLPVLFVCEDNGVAAFTATASVTAGPGVSARAESLGVPATGVDGNDVAAVDAAVGRIVAGIRAGSGPHLLHAKTFRWTGHTSTDAAAWRDPAEVEAGKARCPIARLRATLFEAGVSGAECDAMVTEAAAEMQASRTTANAAAWPAGAVAYDDVQDTGAMKWQA
ncbi:MAG: TPP-dependent pyruvate/acetoin dehydrogenase alpha subunit [Hyphomicrobiaceae bacterium]|jgi:acetoin:2,6-dichlorophenolindophenol oxidoreductase subunit alpha